LGVDSEIGKTFAKLKHEMIMSATKICFNFYCLLRAVATDCCMFMV